MKELEELVPQLEALMDDKASLEQAVQRAQEASSAAEAASSTLQSQACPPEA